MSPEGPANRPSPPRHAGSWREPVRWIRRSRRWEWLERSIRVSRVSVRTFEPRTGDLVIESVCSRCHSHLGPGLRVPARATAFLEVTRGTRRSSPMARATPPMNQILLEEGIRSWVAIPLHERAASSASWSCSVGSPTPSRMLLSLCSRNWGEQSRTSSSVCCTWSGRCNASSTRE